ncbi:MAG: zinc metalloprotease HtpX [Nanoarchaeota archaeon]|nr:zinc metalloprotease HtpX [Nanoarchaeota archaeon]
MSFTNNFRTVILLGALTALLLWVGDLVGGPTGLAIALIFALILNFVSFWYSDKIVLKMYRAQPAPRNSRLHKLVSEVAHMAQIPVPKAYIVPGAHPNAFATGRDPKHAAVAATEALINMLNDSELKGVIAHEISHIKNRDTLIQAVAATIAGVISYVAMMARFAAIFGGFGGRDNDDGNFAELIVLAILTPLLAAIIQMAISRSREYQADESAARTLHDTTGLASALGKIEHGIRQAPLRANSNTETTAHLFIANPFRGTGLVALFSTHPPMKQRIDRLKSLVL